MTHKFGNIWKLLMTAKCFKMTLIVLIMRRFTLTRISKRVRIRWKLAGLLSTFHIILAKKNQYYEISVLVLGQNYWLLCVLT